MKSLYSRSGLSSLVALACALGLSGCGGSTPNLAVGGSITGLTKPGLVLKNGDGPDLPVPAYSASFVFNEYIRADDEFNVTVKTDPTAAHCTVVNGKGRSAFNVNTIIINCITESHELSGTIVWPDKAKQTTDPVGLILNNGNNAVTIAANSPAFTFNKPITDSTGKPVTDSTGKATYSGQVDDGSAYGVTVAQQPAGATCSVTNGVGTMGTVPVTNVLVTCVAAP
jgi:hypothetical protein